MAIRLQRVARMTGAAIGALGVDTGLTARLTTQSLAFIYILADSATAFQIKASLTSTYLREVGKHEDFLKTSTILIKGPQPWYKNHTAIQPMSATQTVPGTDFISNAVTLSISCRTPHTPATTRGPKLTKVPSSAQDTQTPAESVSEETRRLHWTGFLPIEMLPGPDISTVFFHLPIRIKFTVSSHSIMPDQNTDSPPSKGKSYSKCPHGKDFHMGMYSISWAATWWGVAWLLGLFPQNLLLHPKCHPVLIDGVGRTTIGEFLEPGSRVPEDMR